ncbi:DUF6884 domain-containing protein [Kitasatospora sp. NPDC097605]|uniref:DUF6884 domain-containing protein n=1 Tax=Kitasatospora sp. NPDC097605 TaxID=3157226 RepID=UPI00332C13B5
MSAVPGDTLPRTAHEAVLAAATDPDHLLPATVHGRTLRYLADHGLAWLRPLSSGHRFTYDQAHAVTVHLTENGRQYALRHGAPAPRRRAVIVACGNRKATTDAQTWLPAGKLYTGSYHRALRRAADALTSHWGTVLILSAKHGLVRPDRLLGPYDMAITDTAAVTSEHLRQHAEAFDLPNAEVVFLGGTSYADVLRPAVPHSVLPLAGTRGIGEQLSRLREYYDPAGSDRRAACWEQAEARAEQGLAERTTTRLQPDVAAAGTIGRPTTPAAAQYLTASTGRRTAAITRSLPVRAAAGTTVPAGRPGSVPRPPSPTQR